MEPGNDVTSAFDQRRRLALLMQEHGDLSASIDALHGVAVPDQMQIARLKKRKLALKDEIARVQDQMVPDIIA